VFCDDSDLAYEKCETEFKAGKGLVFDEAYRLAHLPLVAPEHPLVLPSKKGSNYNNGTHEVVYSIAIPIPSEELFVADNFRKLQKDISASSFAAKFSWDSFHQRANKLHATVCGGLSRGNAPVFDENVYQKLNTIGPMSVSVRGLFSGNVNIGRLYLKLYPERRDGKNLCHEIQTIFESRKTDLYVVGLFNLVDELNAVETIELKQLLEKWRDVEIIRLQVDSVWLLWSRDDLVLDGGIGKSISLVH